MAKGAKQTKGPLVRLRIEELIKERGTTAYRLAVDSGIGHTALWKLRHNKQPSIKLDQIGQLCETLQCTPNDLFEIGQKLPGAKRKS
ncbi:MAG TPA: helix-turn-helix transcriptional regulator [Blastocatellia bacterium]